MNLVGHVHVARLRGADDPETWLGAMVPDLAAEAGGRFSATSGWSTAVLDGVGWHRATDRAFHASRPFLDGVHRLREDLSAAGLARGPARAVAHAGWELVLDGVLLDDGATVGAYLAALDVPPGRFGPGMAAADADRWSAALARRRSLGVPAAYADPAGVAEVLHRILQRRPRLSFGAASVPAVAAVLADHQPAVRAAAERVVADAGRW